MAEIRVGTASWTDKSLIDSGRFYPPQARTPEARLRYYSSKFSLVEVDSSYYGIPKAESALAWTQRTPPDFSLNIKAYRLFTCHQTPLVSLPKDVREALGPWNKANIYYKDMPGELRDELWTRFRQCLFPLQDAGKLGSVHFQFAPWCAFHPHSLAHIEECQSQLPGFRLAVEFRNFSWFSPEHAQRTLDFQRDRQLVHVIVDEPQGFSNSIPSVWTTTHPELAIVRLHGRNSATWNAKGLSASSDRFNYDYPDDELDEIARHVEQLEVPRIDVIFNNNYEDQGQRNAATLARLLRAEVS